MPRTEEEEEVKKGINREVNPDINTCIVYNITLLFIYTKSCHFSTLLHEQKILLPLCAK